MKHLKIYEEKIKYNIGDYVILNLVSETFIELDVKDETELFNEKMKNTAFIIIDFFKLDEKDCAIIYAGDTSLPIDTDISMDITIEDIKRHATKDEIETFDARIAKQKYNI